MWAEGLFRGEGFTEVQWFLHGTKGFYETLGSGEADIGGDFATSIIIQLDKGRQSWSWEESMSAALCCSGLSRSARFAT